MKQPRDRTISTLLALPFLCGLALAQTASGPRVIGGPLAYRYVATPTGAGESGDAKLVDEHVARAPGRDWIALELGGLVLGDGSRLEVESLRDGEKQTFVRSARSVDTAYFNGAAVRLRLYAGRGTAGNTYRIDRLFVSTPDIRGPSSLCGADNRSPFNDKRIGRLLVRNKEGRVSICTAFLISPWNCFATAGTCLKDLASLRVQFAVPPSTATGAIQHPPAQHQYEGPVTYAFKAGGWGDNWGVFTTKKNTATGLYPGPAQGGYLRMNFGAIPPQLLVTGYGRDTTPLTRNHVRQLGLGALHSTVGTQLRHTADTELGSEGSPVYVTAGFVYGIHGHDACQRGPFNVATRVTHPTFRSWVAKLCKTPSEPDLVPISFSLQATTVEAGSRYVFASRIRNAGGAASTLAISGYYLSKNSTISTADKLVVPFRTPALSVGTHHSHSTNARIPSDLEAGTCWPGVYADSNGTVSELSETNNALAGRPVKCVNKLPDLVVDLFQSDVAEIWPGRQVKLTTRICNKGHSAIASATNGHYLSTDSTIATTDPLIGSFAVGAMLPNACRLDVRTVTIPAFRETGPCWLGAFADNARAIQEISETNNTKSLAVKCGKKPRPDLVIRALTASTTTWQASTLLGGQLTLGNIGATASAGSRTGIVLSVDPQISSSDTLLVQLPSPQLGAGKSVALSYRVVVPNSIKSGSCWLGAIADHTALVEEEREDNNTRSLAGRCIGRPDLVISRLVRTPPVVQAGSFVTAAIDTRNIGGAAAGASRTGVFLSTDAMITTDDVILESYAVPGLVAGGTSSRTSQYRIPFCTPAGAHFFGALADARAQIAEISEANNDRAETLTVQAYAGTARRIEWRHARLDNTNGPVSAEDARFPRASAFSGRMCIVAPNDVGDLYVVAWSSNPAAFAFDFWSGFQLSLINTPIFVNHIGVIPASGRANLGIQFPNPGLPATTIYKYVAFLGGGISWADNRLRMEITP